MTKFLILAAEDPTNTAPNLWREVATLEAGSKEQALRSVGGTGTFVAVPARSWQPVSLEVQTVQRTKISAATAEPKADA